MMSDFCLKYAISRFEILMSGTFAQLTTQYEARSRSYCQISFLAFVSGMFLIGA
jgi:hypothetical protein